MTVRCKFRLNTVTRKLGHKNVGNNKYEQVVQYDAAFSAVYSEDANSENRRFWDATPSGEFKVTTVNEMPWELGKEYYLDITPVVPPDGAST